MALHPSDWNGWIKPPSFAEVEPITLPPQGQLCNLDSPCLFDIFTDPTEHHDVAVQHPRVVATMKSRILDLLKGEVTLADSNICPRETGTKCDPKMTAKARQTGFWEPWLAPKPGAGQAAHL